MIVKLNNNVLIEKTKKQASKKVIYKINADFIKNNITTTKLYATQTLSSRDIAIQITNKKEAKKLREEDGQTKILKSKTKLIQKWYKIVVLEICNHSSQILKDQDEQKEMLSLNKTKITH